MLVIPVFIPHQGCPQNCLFCNQVSISGKHGAEEEAQQLVSDAVDTWLSRSKKHSSTQLAFYGGSFTCLPHARQQRLLEAVQPFISRGQIHSIRLSTRPDCIDRGICRFLKEMQVATVELGVQSLDDTVLQAAQRGHTAEDCLVAAQVIRESGLTLGVQLMPGLPKENSRSWVETVEKAVQLSPDFVRLYPTLVVEGSGLAKAYAAKRYQPLSLHRAIAYCLRGKECFERADIPVLRMGLQPSDSLEKNLVAGPYHPAFGECVNSRHWLKRTRKILAVSPIGSHTSFRLSHRDVSSFVGPKRYNIERLEGVLHSAGQGKTFSYTTDRTLVRGTLKYVVT